MSLVYHHDILHIMNITLEFIIQIQKRDLRVEFKKFFELIMNHMRSTIDFELRFEEVSMRIRSFIVECYTFM